LACSYHRGGWPLSGAVYTLPAKRLDMVFIVAEKVTEGDRHQAHTSGRRALRQPTKLLRRSAKHTYSWLLASA